MKCFDCDEGEYVQLDGLWGGNWTCDNCSDVLSLAVYEEIEAMQAVIDDLKSTAQVQQLKHKADAHSAAADLICNQWNLLERTEHWVAMTFHFQDVWANLKALSNDYHVLAVAEAANCTGPQPCGHSGCKRCEGGTT